LKTVRRVNDEFSFSGEFANLVKNGAGVPVEDALLDGRARIPQDYWWRCCRIKLRLVTKKTAIGITNGTGPFVES
jgi:hypothetical protein